MIQRTQIADLADIRFGLYEQPGPSGVAYLQVKQFAEEGQLVKPADEFVALHDKNISHLLQDGDVLFVGKGSRLFAWCYRETFGPALASSIFFVLRPRTALVHPEYLATLLNAQPSRDAFRRIGAGTNILSIRKSELGAFEIPLPPPERQKKIAALAALHQRQILLAEQIVYQKKRLHTAVINQLIK